MLRGGDKDRELAVRGAQTVLQSALDGIVVVTPPAAL